MLFTVITLVMMSVTVNPYYDSLTTRWGPDSRGRLEQAAVTLFAERGFDDTTVSEIAERAGLTERTFFRHFSDKREILFSDSAALQSIFVDTVTSAPATASPFDAIALSLGAVGDVFGERRDFAQRRQRIITSSPELQERELIKLASLSAALAAALSQRGVNEPAASLVGEVAIAVFKVAFERWIDEANQNGLSRLFRESLDELRAVTAGDSH